jgi:hypothetical protein
MCLSLLEKLTATIIDSDICGNFNKAGSNWLTIQSGSSGGDIDVSGGHLQVFLRATAK